MGFLGLDRFVGLQPPYQVEQVVSSRTKAQEENDFIEPAGRITPTPSQEEKNGGDDGDMKNVNPCHMGSHALDEPDSMIQEDEDTNGQEGEIDPARGIRALETDKEKEGDNQSEVKQREDHGAVKGWRVHDRGSI